MASHSNLQALNDVVVTRAAEACISGLGLLGSYKRSLQRHFMTGQIRRPRLYCTEGVMAELRDRINEVLASTELSFGKLFHYVPAHEKASPRLGDVALDVMDTSGRYPRFAAGVRCGAKRAVYTDTLHFDSDVMAFLKDADVIVYEIIPEAAARQDTLEKVERWLSLSAYDGTLLVGGSLDTEILRSRGLEPLADHTVVELA